MNTSPQRPVPPPADEDFAATFGDHGQIPTESVDIEDGDPISEDEQPEVTEEHRKLSHNTMAELRELQRVMMDVARTDEFGSAKASAARAWKELEILRLAKLGKPLTLNVTAKALQTKVQVAPALTPMVFERAA